MLCITQVRSRAEFTSEIFQQQLRLYAKPFIILSVIIHTVSFFVVFFVKCRLPPPAQLFGAKSPRNAKSFFPGAAVYAAFSIFFFVLIERFERAKRVPLETIVPATVPSTPRPVPLVTPLLAVARSPVRIAKHVSQARFTPQTISAEFRYASNAPSGRFALRPLRYFPLSAPRAASAEVQAP